MPAYLPSQCSCALRHCGWTDLPASRSTCACTPCPLHAGAPTPGTGTHPTCCGVVSTPTTSAHCCPGMCHAMHVHSAALPASCCSLVVCRALLMEQLGRRALGALAGAHRDPAGSGATGSGSSNPGPFSRLSFSIAFKTVSGRSNYA